MGWKPIVDPEVRQMIGPDNGNADWKGWAFEHEKKALHAHADEFS